jgi:hypothetical protein
VHIVQHGLEDGVGQSLTRRMSSDCTSGMPAFNRVASSWLNTRNSWRGIVACAARTRSPPKPLRGPQREDVQALLLEFAAERGLALGDVHALDDLTRRGAEAAAEFHP